MIKIDELKELAKQYDVEVCLKGYDCVQFISKGNLWFCYLRDLPDDINDRKRIYLYHKSHDNKKEHYHTQRPYFKIWHMIESIATHDIHMFQDRKKSKKQLLLEQVSSEINSKKNCKANIDKLHSDKKKYSSPHIDFKKLGKIN